MTVYDNDNDNGRPTAKDVHRREWSFYWALLIVVPVWAISPLSWFTLLWHLSYNGLRLVPPDAGVLHKLGIIWALLEVSSSRVLSPP